jgi:hypothetical protein
LSILMILKLILNRHLPMFISQVKNWFKKF